MRTPPAVMTPRPRNHRVRAVGSPSAGDAQARPGASSRCCWGRKRGVSRRPRQPAANAAPIRPMGQSALAGAEQAPDSKGCFSGSKANVLSPLCRRPARHRWSSDPGAGTRLRQRRHPQRPRGLAPKHGSRSLLCERPTPVLLDLRLGSAYVGRDCFPHPFAYGQMDRRCHASRWSSVALPPSANTLAPVLLASGKI
jgi:hypothetical protein